MKLCPGCNQLIRDDSHCCGDCRRQVVRSARRSGRPLLVLAQFLRRIGVPDDRIQEILAGGWEELGEGGDD